MKLLTLSCGLHQHDLPIVGTRTMCYQYFARFQNEQPIWLGLRANSDFDYFSNTLPRPESPNGDLFRGTLGVYFGLKAPYKTGDFLYKPSTMHYLYFSITKRILKYYGTSEVFSRIGKEFILMDKAGNDLLCMPYYPVPQSLWIRGPAFAKHRNAFLEILQINALT